MAKQPKPNRNPKRTAASKVAGNRKKTARTSAKKAGAVASKKKAAPKKAAPKKVARKKASAKRGISSKGVTKAAGRSRSVSGASPKTARTTKAARTIRAKAAKQDAGGERAPNAASRVSGETEQAVARARNVETKPLPKTHLRPEQLEEFRTLLLEKRAELAGAVQHLKSDLTNAKNHGPSEHASMPIHMADVGSDNWEKEFTLGLIENEHGRIREIDEALARIDDETYGRCLVTRRRINLARLRAKPWAKYCIEYARAREEGRTL